MKQDFGLHIFTTLHPVNEEMSAMLNIEEWHESEDWQEIDDHQPNRTRMYMQLAYLVLPNQLTRDGVLLFRKDWVTPHCYDYGEEAKLDMSSFSIIEPQMLQLTDEQKRLFKCVLNLFHLEPFIRSASAVSLQAHQNRKNGPESSLPVYKKKWRGWPSESEELRDHKGVRAMAKSKSTMKQNSESGLTIRLELQSEAWPKLMNLTTMQVDIPPESFYAG